MTKHGVHAKALAERFRAAPPGQRLTLAKGYQAWIKAGAKAGQWWLGSGIAFIGLPLIFAATWWEAGEGLPPTGYAVGALCILLGGLLFRHGAKLEKAWREDNPFETWRP